MSIDATYLAAPATYSAKVRITIIMCSIYFFLCSTLPAMVLKVGSTNPLKSCVESDSTSLNSA